MLRIHFTAEDLARVRLAPAADPMWEMLLSLHMLGGHPAANGFDGWRRQTRSRLSPAVSMLPHLAPPHGYSADFLTPTSGGHDPAAGIDAVLSTPRTRLRTDMFRLANQRTLPGWAGQLAAGDTGTLRQLGAALQRYFDAALGTHWNLIHDQVGADRARRARIMVSQGVEPLLATLHPTVRWEPPVLHVLYPVHRTLHLDGRGLVLLPSFFCWLRPLALREPDLPPVLVYPIEHDHGRLDEPTGGAGAGLPALVGQTRAAVLRALADQEHGCTTTELAQLVGVSPPTASEHAAVLRRAGLATTRPHGKHVLHTLTLLGHALLAGEPDPS